MLCGKFPLGCSPHARQGRTAGSHTDFVTVVSQFTLLAKTTKGSKPDFHGAMGGEEASKLYRHFFKKVQDGFAPEKVKDGKFQAMMEVALVNDGPVRKR